VAKIFGGKSRIFIRWYLLCFHPRPYLDHGVLVYRYSRSCHVNVILYHSRRHDFTGRHLRRGWGDFFIFTQTGTVPTCTFNSAVGLYDVFRVDKRGDGVYELKRGLKSLFQRRLVWRTDAGRTIGAFWMLDKQVTPSSIYTACQRNIYAVFVSQHNSWFCWQPEVQNQSMALKFSFESWNEKGGKTFFIIIQVLIAHE
jgi:hypothetical protein